MGETTNFGLSTVGGGESIADDGHKYTLRDRETIDALLWTLFNHNHATELETAPFAGPTQRPTLTLTTTGGELGAGQDLAYRISYRDTYGNETEASLEAQISTPPAIASPVAFELSTVTTGGSLGPGIYRYAVAYIQAGGKTTKAPNISSIIVPTGTITNTVTIQIGSLPSGASGWDIYRRDPATDEYYFLATTASGPTFVDDGSDTLDCTRKRPSFNTTNSTNRVLIEIDPTDLPLNPRITAWRIFRASQAGAFTDNSLLIDVSDTLTEGGADLVTEYDDTGGGTSPGQPLEVSVVPPAPLQLDASATFSADSGRLPAAVAPWKVHQFHTFCTGALTDALVYNQVLIQEDMTPSRIDVSLLAAPTGANAGNHAIVRVKDDAAVNEIQNVYNTATENNEIQKIVIAATAGTFTLTFSAQTTSALDWDCTAAELDTALEALSNITTVFVTGSGTTADPFYVEFTNPGNQNVAQMTANVGSLTGTVTITTTVAGSDGGTFTLTFEGQTTGAIAYDASAAALDTALEALSNITTVTVTGTGTLADPWVVEFTNPGAQNVDLMTADATLLHGNVFIEEVTRGHGNTILEVACDANTAYHFWTVTSTPGTDQEAEVAPATTTGITVSDSTALNDSAIELNAQTEYVAWNLGVLDPGDYVARFHVSNYDLTSTFELKVTDLPSTTIESASITAARGSYVPAYELEFTADGTEDFEFRVTKTDSGTDRVRVDKFEYEAFLDTFLAGQTLTVEVDIVGVPTTPGSNAQVNVWY